MPALASLTDAVSSRPRLSALAAGGIAACGFQPLALWPLTLFAMALLIELVARARGWKRAFGLGWLFGLGHFTVGNFWIATAFTYQAEMPAWLGVVAVVALALYLAVFPGLAALGAWVLARRGANALVPGFAAAWIVSEWLRAWVFTGFAWNPLGVALLGGFDTPGLAMLTPWIGTYGLSGLAVLLAGVIRTLAVSAAPNRARALRAAGWSALVAATMLVPAVWLPEPAGTLPYTLVQPDVRQERLDDSRYYDADFAKTAALTLPRVPGQRRLVLWPESGVPDYLRDGYPQWLYDGLTWRGDPALARGRIARVIGPGSLLLTGAVDLELVGGRPVAARNVVSPIDGNGRIHGGYAKAHLVPFGEYLALRWLLEPLGATRLVPGALDFWPGPGPRTLDLGPWGQAGIQICYEIIFSGQVVDPAHRPDYIFNPSNDGWFGSWGPPQHLAQARLRAIEEGLPVLRATTTGISAVIDADGVVRAFVPRHVAGRLDGVVPPAHAPTPFARAGNAIPLGLALGLLVLSLVASRRRRG